MILQHYSWLQFLIAALLLSIIWYAAIVLAFYRKEIIDFLNGRNIRITSTQPVPHAWDEELEDEAVNETDNLMGKAALPEGMSRVSMSMFGFAPVIADFNDKKDEDRERQQSTVPDVIEELKSVFHILETRQGTKEDFISLFALVSSKYPNIRGTSNQRALNEYIRDNVLFPISDDELDRLWP